MLYFTLAIVYRQMTVKWFYHSTINFSEKDLSFLRLNFSKFDCNLCILKVFIFRNIILLTLACFFSTSRTSVFFKDLAKR